MRGYEQMTARQQVTLQQHALSAAFPSMPESDLEALAEDIKKHGQREPGFIFEGAVLDGWHRYLACERIGLEFWADDFTGEDPRAYVLSKNLHRRHLTGGQRASAIVAASNWRPSGVKGELSSSLTNEQMAEAAEVSVRTIQHAKKAHDADPALGKAMREGEVSPRRAAEIADLPKSERKRALKAPKPRIPGRVVDASALQAFEKLKAESRDLHGKYADLAEKLAETQDALGEMTDLAKSAKAFEDKQEFKEMQVLRLELKSCKRRRDELMAENSSLKKHIAHLQKKAGKK